MRTRRGGDFFRVCKPDWRDCSDTTHSRIHGGRWNAPGGHEVLYLNRTERLAALQAIENFRGEAHSLYDLRPERRPHLQSFSVADDDYVDAVSEAGLRSLRLPADYPAELRDDWTVCQEIGDAAYRAGEQGIACRSACAGAEPTDEELALFVRSRRAAPEAGERRPFAEWFPTGRV